MQGAPSNVRSRRPRTGSGRPRTLDGALDRMGDANLVLVSTPGVYAVREARRALDRGLNVMLFSDNVPLASERALKERAHALGLLVMGPDCGTAYIAGTRSRSRTSPPGAGGGHRGIGDRAAGGGGAARARRSRHLARNRGGWARSVRCGRGSEHPRRHRPPLVGCGNRSRDSRFKAAWPAHRAPGLRAARGGRQTVHRGRVRRGRDRGPSGRPGSGPDAEGCGRTGDGMPDRARPRRRGPRAARGAAAGAGTPCAARSVLRRHAGDGGARGARGGGDRRRLRPGVTRRVRFERTACRDRPRRRRVHRRRPHR